MELKGQFGVALKHFERATQLAQEVRLLAVEIECHADYAASLRNIANEAHKDNLKWLANEMRENNDAINLS